MPKRLIVLAAVLVLAPSFAPAQTPTPAGRSVVVRVRVTDAKGKPIRGASASWRLITETQWSSGKSDDDGRFDLSTAPGPLLISIFAAGFSWKRDSFPVSPRDTIDREIIMRSHRSSFLYGVHLGVPAGASLAIAPTYLLGADGSRPPGAGHALAFAVVEPGFKAGRLSAGYLRPMGSMIGGWTARGTLLRKWKESPQTFAGAELSAMPFFLIGPRVGLFRRVQGGSGWFVFADFGIGM